MTIPDGVQWSLAGTRPGPLAWRFTVAALGVGIVGGMITACLFVLFESTRTGWIFAVGLPVLLVAMIGGRLVAVTDQGPPPSWRVFVLVTGAGLGLTVVVQLWSEVGGLGDRLVHNAGVLLLILINGAVLGLIPAAVAAVVLVRVALHLREGRRVSLRAAQVGITGFAMVVTGVFALWVASSMHAGIVGGVAPALAGVGAVLTARWCLVDPQS